MRTDSKSWSLCPSSPQTYEASWAYLVRRDIVKRGRRETIDQRHSSSALSEGHTWRLSWGLGRSLDKIFNADATRVFGVTANRQLIIGACEDRPYDRARPPVSRVHSLTSVSEDVRRQINRSSGCGFLLAPGQHSHHVGQGSDVVDPDLTGNENLRVVDASVPASSLFGFITLYAACCVGSILGFWISRTPEEPCSSAQ